MNGIGIIEGNRRGIETDFVTSDLHFDHANVILHCSRVPWIYDNPNYNPNKPYHFKYNHPKAVYLKEHNDALIENWNEIVGKNDRIIILGDFAFKNHRYFIEALNGKHKIFVKGNHDKAPSDFYDLFKDYDVAKPENIGDVRKECNSALKRFRNGDIDINNCTDHILSSIWSKFLSLQDFGSIDEMSKECLNLFDNVHEMGFRTRIQGQDVTFCHYGMRTWASSCHGSLMLHGHSHCRLYEPDNMLSFDVGIDGWGYAPVPWCVIAKKKQIIEEKIQELKLQIVDGEGRFSGNYISDPDQRVIDTRKKNKAIMQAMGIPINETMWPNT